MFITFKHKLVVLYILSISFMLLITDAISLEYKQNDPPSSCVLTRKEKSFHCFSPCIKEDENFTMMWRFQDKTLQAENIKTVPSVCDQHETGIKNTTLKNYTGVIKQNQNGHFKDEGQLTCSCGIEGYPTTVIESAPLEVYFYDCSIAVCVLVTIPIAISLIVISNGIIYFRVKTAGCLAFIKQWLCMVIIKGIVDLLVLALVIGICHIGCITETWKVTILIILLPVSYTISCLIFWFLCAKPHKNRRKHYFFGVCCVQKDKRERDSDVERITSPKKDKANGLPLLERKNKNTEMLK